MPAAEPQDDPPPRPRPPLQAECCGGDCGSGCVFEVYARELERWQARYEPN